MIAFLAQEEGQGMVEYALVLAIISITIILALVFFRGQLLNLFSNIGNNLT